MNRCASCGHLSSARYGPICAAALAGLVGIPVCSLTDHVRVNFAKVIEYQRRGVVHIHAVIRLDGPGGPDGPCPDIGVDTLVAALRIAVSRVRAPNPASPDDPVAWGTQVDVEPIEVDKRRVVAAYTAKYSTKSPDEAGALDHRLRSADTSGLDLCEHMRMMVDTAWRLGGEEHLAHLSLRYWAHCLGFRGHWLTKSRRYSTTLDALREARHQFRLAQVYGLQRLDPWGRPYADGESMEVGSWTYSGSGYTNSGDAWLAA